MLSIDRAVLAACLHEAGLSEERLIDELPWHSGTCPAITIDSDRDALQLVIELYTWHQERDEDGHEIATQFDRRTAIEGSGRSRRLCLPGVVLTRAGVASPRRASRGGGAPFVPASPEVASAFSGRACIPGYRTACRVPYTSRTQPGTS
ncbi:hypothetical protein GCM10009733_008380 [Nonomuraea maheshkhaliensis]|uniref:DUF2007 domain-containing protein n=1 Tax=Nonomuraea maheshkhaliensis TaxID=419590 RepID=A0ABN2EQF0_9ACTN